MSVQQKRSYVNKSRIIYAITNTHNDKKYIGITINYARRKWQHMYDLKAKRHSNKELQNDFDKGDDFTFSILEYVVGLRSATQREAELIKMHNDHCYNVLAYSRPMIDEHNFEQYKKEGLI